MENLKKREITDKLITYIDIPEVLVLYGARQVGKTSLMKILINNLKKSGKETFYFDLENEEYLRLFNSGVKNVAGYINARTTKVNTDSKIYLFIDEVQYLNNPSSLLKLFYDHYKNNFKLIVSGSSSFAMKSKFKNSLVGRVIDFEITGLSFSEYLNFKNLNYSFDSGNEAISKELKYLYIEYILYGFYPQVANTINIEMKEVYIRNIIEKYIYKDIKDIANIRNIEKFNLLIKLLASQAGQLLNLHELASTTGISRNTLEEYLFILENTFIIKLLKPFFKNVRSELTKMPKVFFEDTGLLNVLRNNKLSDTTDGNIFENSIYNYLRRIVNLRDLHFWRTVSKQEVDFIINTGNIYAVESKLNALPKSPKGLYSFQKKYSKAKLVLVTLEKTSPNNFRNVKQLYPWELGKLVVSDWMIG